MAPRTSPGPSPVSGRYRVEGGIGRSGIAVSWLGVPCPSRLEENINKLCLTSCCGVEFNAHESRTFVWVCKKPFARCLFLRLSWISHI